jgi:hypothetical protein
VDVDDLPDCPDCLTLTVEALAKSAADPESLARLDPEQASQMREYLATLLNRPNDSLEELARALAVRAKKSVGIFQN